MFSPVKIVSRFPGGSCFKHSETPPYSHLGNTVIMNSGSAIRKVEKRVESVMRYCNICRPEEAFHSKGNGGQKYSPRVSCHVDHTCQIFS